MWVDMGDGPDDWRPVTRYPEGTTLLHRLTASWSVQEDGTVQDPTAVPRRHRCVQGSYETLHCWPPPLARTPATGHFARPSSTRSDQTAPCKGPNERCPKEGCQSCHLVGTPQVLALGAHSAVRSAHTMRTVPVVSLSS